MAYYLLVQWEFHAMLGLSAQEVGVRISGRTVVPGVAQGPLWSPPTPVLSKGSWEDVLRARARFTQELSDLDPALATAHRALAEDAAWEPEVRRRLEEGQPLGQALVEAAEALAAPLRAVEDAYLRERAQDLIQIGHQLARLAAGEEVLPPEGALLCAASVSPAELLRWHRRLGGLLLCGVSPTAHLAIVARGLGLPALALGRELLNWLGHLALLEATMGWVEVDPSPELLQAHPAERIRLEPDPEPLDRVKVLANLNRPEEALWAREMGADGVGLLRTEFLYTGRSEPPSLELERASYQMVAQALAGKPIVVRTLDVGGDKSVPYLSQEGQDQGMLGIRGLRLSLRHPELFRCHLQAILEGFSGSQLWLMFPMVSRPEEFAQAVELLRSLHQPLPRLGLMLEVPAAAYDLDGFARMGASFISLGTNDLLQYFFAASRLEPELSDLQDPAAPAFQEFLREIVQKAHRVGLEVGVCGEAAGDPRLTAFWLEAGVDELSVTPGLVPWLKARLRQARAEGGR